MTEGVGAGPYKGKRRMQMSFSGIATGVAPDALVGCRMGGGDGSSVGNLDWCTVARRDLRVYRHESYNRAQHCAIDQDRSMATGRGIDCHGRFCDQGLSLGLRTLGWDWYRGARGKEQSEDDVV